MLITVHHREKDYKVNLNRGIDISIPLSDGIEGPNCFYAPLFESAPLKVGDFIGDTRHGSPVNFYNIKLNPHGNGTHTECVGHIATERISINQSLKTCHSVANLVSMYPQLMGNGDRVITHKQTYECLQHIQPCEALIIRTMPNHHDKRSRIYSGTNPPYFDKDAIATIIDQGYQHLLVDLPSIDREEDGGLVMGHKTFWNYPAEINTDRTITEMVYVPDEVKDGMYFINMQIPPFDLDAASSRVFLYSMDDVK